MGPPWRACRRGAGGIKKGGVGGGGGGAGLALGTPGGRSPKTAGVSDSCLPPKAGSPGRLKRGSRLDVHRFVDDGIGLAEWRDSEELQLYRSTDRDRG